MISSPPPQQEEWRGGGGWGNWGISLSITPTRERKNCETKQRERETERKGVDRNTKWRRRERRKKRGSETTDESAPPPTNPPDIDKRYNKRLLRQRVCCLYSQPRPVSLPFLSNVAIKCFLFHSLNNCSHNIL